MSATAIHVWLTVCSDPSVTRPGALILGSSDSRRLKGGGCFSSHGERSVKWKEAKHKYDFQMVPGPDQYCAHLYTVLDLFKHI